MILTLPAVIKLKPPVAPLTRPRVLELVENVEYLAHGPFLRTPTGVLSDERYDVELAALHGSKRPEALRRSKEPFLPVHDDYIRLREEF